MFLECVFFGELMVDERFAWCFSTLSSWQTSCKVYVQQLNISPQPATFLPKKRIKGTFLCFSRLKCG